MRVLNLLPDKRHLRLESAAYADGGERFCLVVRSILPSSRCPKCGEASERVHSRYQRKLADLPCQGMAIEITWNTRKFFCTSSNCPQKIFAERRPEVAAPSARKTTRLTVTLGWIALACGGELGSRLAQRLGIKTSADTLLREVRRLVIPEKETPRALGVDDWAFCKGRKYGTVICDLERGCAVELLPDRTAEQFQRWLESRTGIEIISRDRGEFYKKGATAGSPAATQVADRFHLMQNLREVLGRVLESFADKVRAAIQHERKESQLPAETIKPVNVQTSESGQSDSQRRRFAVYQEVLALHREGVSGRSIAKRVGIHRETVAKYLNSPCFPERGIRKYSSHADDYEDYLWQQWAAGSQNIRKLWKEIQQQGFTGSYDSINRFVRRWKTNSDREQTKVKKVRLPSPTQVSWLLVKDPAKLTATEQRFKASVLERCPEFRSAWQLAEEFMVMLRTRSGDQFDNWLQRAKSKDLPPPLQRFAKGLETDLAAVRAALTLAWNNGSSEGHVSRLKMIKRQMYGRANFDLLRARFLLAA